MRVPVTLACGVYDRTFGLFDGSVRAEGLELTTIPLGPGEMFRRQARWAEFDVSEFSLATLMILADQQDDRFVGIPVYPSRRFRHEHIWINTRRGIRGPEDLAGRRIGVQEYIQTASVWIRGTLAEHHGVADTDVDWFVGGYNEPEPEYAHRIPLELHRPGVRVQVLDGDRCINDMLEAGELDAAFPARPRALAEGSPNVAPLFPDFGKVERAYYRATGIFPIMHVVVIRRELYERHRWIAVSIAKAFEDARALAMRRLLSSHGPLACSVPWLNEALRSSVETLGRDFWSYGLAGNDHVIRKLASYLHAQGLIAKPIDDVASMFAPETRMGFEAQPA